MDNLPKLADQGILGVLLIVSIGTNSYLFKLLLSEKDKRLTESQDRISKSEEQSKAVTEAYKLVVENLEHKKL